MDMYIYIYICNIWLHILGNFRDTGDTNWQLSFNQLISAHKTYITPAPKKPLFNLFHNKFQINQLHPNENSPRNWDSQATCLDPRFPIRFAASSPTHTALWASGR